MSITPETHKEAQSFVPVYDASDRLVMQFVNKLLLTAGRRVRRRFKTPERLAALWRAVKNAFTVTLDYWAIREESEVYYLEIFEKWLLREEVLDEFSLLLTPSDEEQLDLELLYDEFEAMGYEPEHLFSVSFSVFIQDMVGGFYVAAREEPALQEVLEIGLLRQLVERMGALTRMEALAAERNLIEIKNVIDSQMTMMQESNSILRSIRQTLMELLPAPDIHNARGLILIEENYRQAIMALFNTLTFKGISPSGRAIALPLESMYVDLKAVTDIPSGADTFSEQERRLLLEIDESGIDMAKKALNQQSGPFQRISISEMLADPTQRGMVILGDPGSGKTTLLHNLALRAAKEENGQVRQLPIFVPLAAYDDYLRRNESSLPLEEFFAVYYEKWRNLPGLAPLFEQVLAQGRGLVLLDGLDEVLDRATRQFVADQVSALIQKWISNGNRLVLTSRIVGYREVSMLASLPHVTLLGFGEEEIKGFAHQWCASFETWVAGGQQTKVVQQRAAIEEKALLDDVYSNVSLQRLATNSLMLTMLALLRRQVGKLPERRIELYERYIRTLIDNWEEARSMGARQQAPERFDPHTAIFYLIDLAFWLQQNKPSGIASRQELIGVLTEISLRFEGSNPAIAPAKAMVEAQQEALRFLQDMRHFAGLLIERGPDAFGFVNLTFEEYFAGRALARRTPEEQWKIILPNLHNPRWQEPILLCAAQLGVIEQRLSLVDELVLRIIYANSENEGTLHRDLFFAAAIATEDIGLSPATLHHIRENLIPLLESDSLDVRESAINWLSQLPRITAREFEGLSELPLEERATLQMKLSRFYLKQTSGDQSENIELAIGHYKSALEVYTLQSLSEESADLHRKLAKAYLMRLRGAQADNIEHAIEHYRAALQVYTLEHFSQEWTEIQSGLAKAYLMPLDGDQADNIERAIEHYHSALQVYTLEHFSQEWAEIQSGLAKAYLMRRHGERADNIERAIKSGEQALRVQQSMPTKWAETISNLGSAYYARLKDARSDNLELAIKSYQQALEVRTAQNMLMEWAETTKGLGAAYSERVQGDRLENLKQALSSLQSVLTVYDRQNYPEQYAAVIQGLENIQQELTRVKFFALWDNLWVEDRERRVRQFCELFSNLANLPLQSYHSSPEEGIHLGIFDFTELFQGLKLSSVDNFPVLFLALEEVNKSHLERAHQYLKYHIGPGNSRALLIPLCNEQMVSDVKVIIGGTLKRAYAYDVICLSRSDLKEIVEIMKSAESRRILRRMILSQVNLARVSSYHSTGFTQNNMFFGREPELQEICDQITSANYILIGGRRIGKTSILKQLERFRLPTLDFRVLWHDCGSTPTENKLVRALVSSKSYKSWFSEQPTNLPTSFSDVIQSIPDDKPLVILLDEVDKLIKPDQATGYQLFNTLRSLANAGQCHFVLCGERALLAELTNPISPLYNFGNNMLIGRLEFHAVEELVTRPMKQLEIKLTDKSKIVQRIWDFTSGHPSIVQGICQKVIERLSQHQDRHLTLDDVDAVVADPGFLRKEFLNVYWQRATVLERLCSLVMAADGKVCTLRAVHKTLTSHGLEVTLHQVNNALERLVDLRNILQRTDEGYEFAVTAFPEVIAKTLQLNDLIALDSETYQHHGDILPKWSGL